MESARECRSGSIAQERLKKCARMHTSYVFLHLFRGQSPKKDWTKQAFRNISKATEGNSFSAALESDSEAWRMGTKDISRWGKYCAFFTVHWLASVWMQNCCQNVQVFIIILDSRGKTATPMVKLGSYCNCFLVMCSDGKKPRHLRRIFQRFAFNGAFSVVLPRNPSDRKNQKYDM